MENRELTSFSQSEYYNLRPSLRRLEHAPRKDDDSLIAVWFFGFQAFLTLGVLILCCYNIVLLGRNGRFKNWSLCFFYVFSFITLFTMELYFLDILFKYNYCIYTCLMSVMIYSYVCTGYCYIINCIQIIHRDTKYDNVGNLKKKRKRVCLYVMIGMLIFLFIGQYIYFISQDCGAYLSSGSLWVVVGMYYATFFFLMITNLSLWRLSRHQNIDQYNVKKKTYLLISCVFGISYLYRSIMDTVQAFNPDKWEQVFLERGVNWCFMALGLHVLGELLPLTLLFYIQLQSNSKSRNTTIGSNTEEDQNDRKDKLNPSHDDYDFKHDEMVKEQTLTLIDVDTMKKDSAFNSQLTPHHPPTNYNSEVKKFYSDTHSFNTNNNLHHFMHPQNEKHTQYGMDNNPSMNPRSNKLNDSNNTRDSQVEEKGDDLLRGSKQYEENRRTMEVSNHHQRPGSMSSLFKKKDDGKQSIL